MSEEEKVESTEFRDEDGNHISLHYDRTGGTQSFELDKLAEALSQAQAQIKGAEKSSKNEFIKYNYADLNSVITAIQVPFANNGLSHSQMIKVQDDGTERLITRLMHKSGQWLASEVKLIPLVQRKGTGWVASDDPQTRLAAITYMRRGSLAAIAGVGQQDLDTNKDEEDVLKGKIAMPKARIKFGDGKGSATGQPDTIEQRPRPTLLVGSLRPPNGQHHLVSLPYYVVTGTGLKSSAQKRWRVYPIPIISESPTSVPKPCSPRPSTC